MYPYAVIGARLPEPVEAVKQRLEAAGLEVSVSRMGELGFQPPNAPYGAGFSRITHYFSDSGGLFSFSHRTEHPDGSPDDCWFQSSSLAEVENAAMSWHFGAPWNLRGWQVPAHKRPEWNRLQLACTVLDAVAIGESEWLEIAGRAAAAPLGALELFYGSGGRPLSGRDDCLYQWVDHESDPTRKLWLRRDAVEAFVVDASVQAASRVPTLVAGWLVPTHEHREWPRSRIERAVATARTVTPPEWLAIEERRQEALGEAARREGFSHLAAARMPFDYQKIEHAQDRGRRLELRLDLAEAFVVVD